MADTDQDKAVLLMDDELFNVQWLSDYLENKGFKVSTASNADEAISLISNNLYRFIVLDLNVPIEVEIPTQIGQRAAVFQRYPGLYVAWHARNQEFRDRQVIIYSVHRDDDVAREADNMRCTYIVKGRARDLKDEISNVLNYDPSKSNGDN